VRKRLAVAGYLADDLGVDGVGVTEADDGWGFAGGDGELVAGGAIRLFRGLLSFQLDIWVRPSR